MALYQLSPALPMAKMIARGLLERFAGDMTALSAGTIYVPNRRAVLSLRQAFLELAHEQHLLLPQIFPLGDIESAAELEEWPAFWQSLSVPIASPEARLLHLAKLLRQSSYFTEIHEKQIFVMARELCRLLDEFAIADKKIADLETLEMEEQYAQHWQRSVTFLQDILLRQWPAWLEKMGVCDSAFKQAQMLDAEAARIDAHGKKATDEAWFLAAGSNGSRPAVSRVLHAIMNHPKGDVILPGLCSDFDEASCKIIRKDPHHPYHIIMRNLHEWGVKARDVRDWQTDSPQNIAYHHALMGAMRSANTAMPPSDEEAVSEKLHLVCCEDEAEEAWVIALMMGEGVAKGQKVNFITAESALARHVALLMRNHYGILVNVTQGLPLAESQAGRYLLLLGLAWQESFQDDVSLLAWLQHPLTCFGLARPEILNKIRHAQYEARNRGKSFHQTVREALGDKFSQLVQSSHHKKNQRPFKDWLGDFIQLAQQCSQREDDAEDDEAKTRETILSWSSDDGRACAHLLERLYAQSHHYMSVGFEEFIAILRFFLEQERYRLQRDYHPNIAIMGSWESRMQDGERIIIGGLYEGVWPQIQEADIWFNRAMRQQLGLPAPEQRIGLAAHDFIQALHGDEIYLTHARRRQDYLAVESRFITRLKIHFPEWAKTIDNDTRLWQSYLRHLKQPAKDMDSCAMPTPYVPPRSMPKKLSATQIENLLQEPYSFYALHILRLRVQPPLFVQHDDQIWGNIVHELLDCESHEPHLLHQNADRLLKRDIASAGKRILMRLRLNALIAFVGAHAPAPNVVHHREIQGKMVLTSQAGNHLTISGKADSLRVNEEGQALLIDYKTGTLPNKTERESLRAPQLPLLAMILQQGGFTNKETKDTIQAELTGLAYWALKARLAKNQITSFISKDQNLQDVIAAYEEEIMQKWDDYLASQSSFAPDIDGLERAFRADYDHLSRRKEWEGKS